MKNYFETGRFLNFAFFSEKERNNTVVPALFEISLHKNPCRQSFILLSGSAQLKEEMLHICSSKKYAFPVNMAAYLFVYLGFYVAFNTVQVIS